MARYQDAPTFADVIIVDDRTNQPKFNPVWLSWFLGLVQIINDSGGTALNHNDLSNLQGGQSNQYYHTTAAINALTAASDADTYTPTIVSSTNVDASSIASPWSYMRYGNIVAGAGEITIDPTTAGLLTIVRVTLPVTTTFTVTGEANGVFTCAAIAGEVAAARAIVASGDMRISWTTASNASNVYHGVFQYQVL